MDAILAADLATNRRRTSIKWRRFEPDVLPLWVAEMDAAPCPAVVTAVTEAMRAGDTGYSYGGPYAEAIAAYAEDTWGWPVPTAGMTQVPDVMIGISEVLRLLTDHRGPVVISPPVYDSFAGFLGLIQREVVEAPLGPDGRLDASALDRAFTQARAGGRRAAYLLCNPHNPTGTVPTHTELSTLAELARAHGVRVVSDEIHAPVTYPGARFVPWLTVPGAENGVAVFSPSKAWNLAGLKAAMAIPGPEAVADLARMPEVVRHGVSHVAAIAHTAALTDGRRWQERLMDELGQNRSLVGRLLAERLPAVGYVEPEATYLAWLDVSGLDLGPDAAAWLRRTARVALNPGPAYGTGGQGRLRLNFATSPQIITEAVDRIAAAL